MDAIVESAKQVLHLDPPKQLIQLINSLYFQSTTSIALKPNQEPARAHICAVLAVEQIGEKLNLPLPDTKRTPIQPGQYSKLLQQFRTTLFGVQTPRKQRQRSARKNAVYDLDEEAEFDLSDEFSDFSEPETSPSKRPPRPNSRLTPRKSPKKRIDQSPTKPIQLFSTKKKVTAPNSKLIERIGHRMGLNEKIIDVVIFAFQKYLELVKDGWGLLYGLYVVIADRADPKVGSEHEKQLNMALREMAPDVHVEGREWVNWAQQIITAQSWIMEVAPHEQQPQLSGAPGGWFQSNEVIMKE